jgi:tRNA modification GTPase
VALQFPETPKWLVRNKADLVETPKTTRPTSIVSSIGYRPFSVSAKTGDGIDDLLQKLTTHARNHLGASEPALVTRQRHRRALEDTLAALKRANSEDVGKDGREEIIAEELRLAARALGRLTGRVDVEDILDVIFRDFCIGK